MTESGAPGGPGQDSTPILPAERGSRRKPNTGMSTSSNFVDSALFQLRARQRSQGCRRGLSGLGNEETPGISLGAAFLTKSPLGAFSCENFANYLPGLNHWAFPSHSWLTCSHMGSSPPPPTPPAPSGRPEARRVFLVDHGLPPAQHLEPGLCLNSNTD